METVFFFSLLLCKFVPVSLQSLPPCIIVERQYEMMAQEKSPFCCFWVSVEGISRWCFTSLKHFQPSDSAPSGNVSVGRDTMSYLFICLLVSQKSGAVLWIPPLSLHVESTHIAVNTTCKLTPRLRHAYSSFALRRCPLMNCLMYGFIFIIVGRFESFILLQWRRASVDTSNIWCM